MEKRKLVFPIVLAAVWITIAAYTLSDFVAFSAVTRPISRATAAATTRRTPPRRSRGRVPLGLLVAPLTAE